MKNKDYLIQLIEDQELTPLTAIRKNCLECSCGNTKEVRFCKSKKCPIYPYRMGNNPKRDSDPDEEALKIIRDKNLTPIKAIRKKCLDCMCGSYKEVDLCDLGVGEKCPLFPYRYGKNPAYDK